MRGRACSIQIALQGCQTSCITHPLVLVAVLTAASGADFLFPEAYAEHKLAERQDSQLASLDPGVMHAAMKPRCNSAPCRKVCQPTRCSIFCCDNEPYCHRHRLKQVYGVAQAAFELLAELMLHDATILNEGVGLLMDLHFDPQRPSVLQLQQYNNLTPHTSRHAPAAM